MSQASFSLMGRGGLMNSCQFPMTDEVICIGTDPNSCAIVYPAGTSGIAPIHCQLVPQEDGWLVVDFSEAGTWLNGRRMSKGQPMPLKVGDEIIVGNSSNSFVMMHGVTDTRTNFPPSERWHEDGFKDKYFNFKGRLNRKRYILRAMLLGFIQAIINNIVIALMHPKTPEEIFGLLLVASLPITGIGYMLAIRRLHDVDRSGWWLLIGFIPIVNLWLLYLIVFKKGTDGSNRFGPDPLA